MFSYTQWALDWLSKAAGHKYIKRIPYQSGGRTRYRYIYNVTHTHGGKHVLDPDHMKVGTKLMLDATSGAEVHGHIQSVSGDKVTFVYDDGPKKGESVTMSKDKLATELDKVHGISGKLDAARKKQSDIVAKLKEKGASAKQIARAEARLKALGGDTPKAETPKAKPKKATAKDNGDPTETKVQAALKKLADPKIKEVFDKITEGEGIDTFDGFDEDKLRLLKELDVPTTLVSLEIGGKTERVNKLDEYDNADLALVHKGRDLLIVGLTGDIKGKTQILVRGIGNRERMVAFLAEAQRIEDIKTIFGALTAQKRGGYAAALYKAITITQNSRTKVDEIVRMNKEARTMSKFVDVAEALAEGPVEGGKDAPTEYVRQSPQVYDSLDKVPKKLRAQLESYVSKDATRDNLLHVIKDDGVLVASDGATMMSIRSTTQNEPRYNVDKQGKKIDSTSTPPPVASILKEGSEAPQVFTISKAQGKQIQSKLATISKVSEGYITIETSDAGRTTISHKGVKLADLPAHNTHEPINVSISYLARALSIGEPFTLSVSTIGVGAPVLNIESESAQQMIVGLRR